MFISWLSLFPCWFWCFVDGEFIYMCVKIRPDAKYANAFFSWIYYGIYKNKYTKPILKYMYSWRGTMANKCIAGKSLLVNRSASFNQSSRQIASFDRPYSSEIEPIFANQTSLGKKQKITDGLNWLQSFWLMAKMLN